MECSKKIKELRESTGMNRKEFCEYFQIPYRTVTMGHNFIPEDETLFSDLYLHPNDEGFKYYSEGVKKAVKE